MNLRIYFLVFCLVFCGVNICAAQGKVTQPQRYVAITFDDLPVVTDLDGDAVMKVITQKLLRHITQAKIPAIGFVNEEQLFDNGKLDASEVALLQMWLQAGLDLGNHTYSHINLNESGLDKYEKDVLNGEIITKKLLRTKHKKMIYFRHPYLHTGNDLQTKLALEKFLSDHGYTVAPVTMFLSDWIFSHAYDKAFLQKNKILMKQVGDAYLPYVEQDIDYWERQSVKLFGREIKQVLLFHANSINAEYLGKIAEMLKKRGYKFISLKEALQDKAYQSPDDYVGEGISWLHRWASTKDDDYELPDEPQVPKFVSDEAGEDQ